MIDTIFFLCIVFAFLTGNWILGILLMLLYFIFKS